jgi:hypothetical protein
MAEKLVLAQTKSLPVPSRPQTLPLEEAIEQIRDDSRLDPEGYLDETVTPFGGE